MGRGEPETWVLRARPWLHYMSFMVALSTYFLVEASI
jgi:hypothetical protein